MSDFMADGLRSMTHSASSKTSVLRTRKTEFDSVEEIKKLFAPNDKDVGVIYVGVEIIVGRVQVNPMFSTNHMGT